MVAHMAVTAHTNSGHDEPHVHMVHDHRDVQGGKARAAVFGISDGLVSNVALILGVAAATTAASTTASAVVIAGVSGLLAGATSMAAGEYVSMKAQNELIERELEIERRSIVRNPEREMRELQSIYEARGVEPSDARQLAEAIHEDVDVALEVHAREELGVDPGGTGDPAGAAISSFIAFAVGALLPLLPWFVVDGTAAILCSVVIGLFAATAVGVALAHFTERSPLRTAARQVTWAGLACSVTFAVGTLLGTAVS